VPIVLKSASLILLGTLRACNGIAFLWWYRNGRAWSKGHLYIMLITSQLNLKLLWIKINVWCCMRYPVMSAAWGGDVSNIKLHLMKLRKQVYGNHTVFIEWNWECVLCMFIYVVQTAKLFVQKTVLVCIYSSLILNWASSAKKLYVEACWQNFNKWLLALMCDISHLAFPCLSIYQHGATWFPLYRFSGNSAFAYF
jgi:hypothetical protein